MDCTTDTASAPHPHSCSPFQGRSSCADDYDVLENGVVVGRIFFLDAVGPQGRPWMWASGHNGDIKRAAYGYEPTREAAMAAFAKSWRRE
jgi:hypothetical protein